MHFYYLGAANSRSWVQLPSGIYQATDNITVNVRDDANMYYTFSILPGFQTDGGSVPAALQWFVPGWSDDSPIINLGYVLHDGCYATACLPRQYADDLLRGMLRDAGLSRFRASTVCWAVNQFACCHYGPEHDTLGSGPFFRMVRYRI